MEEGSQIQEIQEIQGETVISSEQAPVKVEPQSETPSQPKAENPF